MKETQEMKKGEKEKKSDIRRHKAHFGKERKKKKE